MTRDDITALVKTKIDELTPFSEGLIVSTANSLTNPISTHIDKFLDNESIEDLLLQAPFQLLPFTSIDSAAISFAGNIAIITLPGDYIRFGMIQFASWQRPVVFAYNEQDPEAKLQLNPYTRAGSAKPVVVLTNAASGKVEFKCYTATDKTNAVATYVRKIVLTDISDRLIPAFTWLVASKVFLSMDMPKEAEQADTMFKNSLIVRGVI
jgi:hypothetical protein